VTLANIFEQENRNKIQYGTSDICLILKYSGTLVYILGIWECNNQNVEFITRNYYVMVHNGLGRQPLHDLLKWKVSFIYSVHYAHNSYILL
jgi:hypothetical protein